MNTNKGYLLSALIVLIPYYLYPMDVPQLPILKKYPPLKRECFDPPIYKLNNNIMSCILSKIIWDDSLGERQVLRNLNSFLRTNKKYYHNHYLPQTCAQELSNRFRINLVDVYCRIATHGTLYCLSNPEKNHIKELEQYIPAIPRCITQQPILDRFDRAHHQCFNQLEKYPHIFSCLCRLGLSTDRIIPQDAQHREQYLNELLCQAAKGYGCLANQLLAAGAQTDGRFKFECPLLVAIGHRRPSMVKFFLEHGVNPHVNGGGTFAGPLAISNCDDKSLQFLLATGADPDPEGEMVGQSLSALYPPIKSLLKHAKQFNRAICTNNRELIDKYLVMGWNLNSYYRGMNQFMWACFYGHVDLVQWMLGKGADIFAKSYSEQLTPYMLLIRWLDASAPGMKKDHGAYRRLLELLPLDLNAQDARGNTSLMYAIQYQNQQVFVRLMAMRANVNIANKINMTPLMEAHKCPVFTKSLLECGADVNTINDTGDSVLMHAIGYWLDNLQVIAELLTSPHIKVNYHNSDGMDAVMRTVLSKRSEEEIIKILELLILRGAQFKNVNAFGKSALNYAQEQKLTKVVEFLSAQVECQF